VPLPLSRIQQLIRELALKAAIKNRVHQSSKRLPRRLFRDGTGWLRYGVTSVWRLPRPRAQVNIARQMAGAFRPTL
jgi:hypothetical protein